MPANAPIDPKYVAELERRLAVAEAEFARVTVQNASLESSNADLTAANARLERMLSQARHARFGPSSERGDPDQRNLFTEDIEVADLRCVTHEVTKCGTNRTCAHAAIADAAFVRSSSKFLPAMQHTPPKQPLKSEIKS